MYTYMLTHTHICVHLNNLLHPSKAVGMYYCVGSDT